MRRDLAGFIALYQGRANAILKALNAPTEKAKQQGLLRLLSHKFEDSVVKPANIVFATDGNEMITFSHLPGEVNLLRDPIFNLKNHVTIMVRSDLYAFYSLLGSAMEVYQIENASQPEKGIKKYCIAQHKRRAFFSLANYKNKAIYVIGGRANKATQI